MKKWKHVIGIIIFSIIWGIWIPTHAEKEKLEATDYIHVEANDVTSQINSFLLECKKQNKDAYFQAGIYKINGTITLRDGVSLFGEQGVVFQGTDQVYQSYMRDDQEKVTAIQIEHIIFDNVTLYFQNANSTGIQIHHNAFINARRVSLDIASGLRPDAQNKNGGESTGYYISKNYHNITITSNLFFRDENSLGRGIGLYKTKDSIIQDNYFGVLEEVDQSIVSSETKALKQEILALDLLDTTSNQGYFMTGINILNSDVHTKIIGNHFSLNMDITEVEYENQSQSTFGYNRDHIIYAKLFSGLEIAGNYFKGMNKNQDGAVKCRNGENLLIYKNVFEDSLILLYVQNAQTNLYLKNVLIKENIFLNKAYTTQLVQLPYRKPDGSSTTLNKYLTIDYLILLKNYNANAVIDCISIVSNQFYSCGLKNEQIRIDNTNFKMPTNLTIKENVNILNQELRLTIRDTLGEENYDSNQGKSPNYQNGIEYTSVVDEYQEINEEVLASCQEIEYQVINNQIQCEADFVYIDGERYNQENLETKKTYFLFIAIPTTITIMVEGEPYQVSSHHYTAQYVKIEVHYQITFHTQGHGIEPDSIKNTTKIPSSLPTLSEKGYRFEGWYMDPACTIEVVKETPITEDITLYAKWVELPTPVEKYSVTYNKKGHGADPIALTDVTALPTELPVLSEEGWTFGGWYYDDVCTKKATALDAITKDTTLYAKWIENRKYTIIFQIIDDQILTKLQVEEGKRIPSLVDPEKKGYRFEGWYLEAKCDTLWDFEKNLVTEDLILYGKWVKTIFTITYQTNGIGACPSITGTELPNPLPEMNESGYRFEGWYYDSNFTTKAKENDGITKDTILYAKWQKLSFYTIQFKIVNGETLAVVSIEENKKLAELIPPEKEGYTFEGWYIDEACTQQWNFNQSITQDQILYGKWNKIEKPTAKNTVLIVSLVLTGIFCLSVAGGIGFFLYKKKK